MIDKNYFMSRIQKGDTVDAICQEMTEAMNAAIAEMEAAEEKKKEEEAKAASRREKAETILNAIKDLAAIEGLDAEAFTFDEEDVQNLMSGVAKLFSTMRAIDAISAVKPLPCEVKMNSDDEILKDFIKGFNF